MGSRGFVRRSSSSGSAWVLRGAALAILAGLALVPGLARAQVFHGRVLRALDGDTIEVERDGTPLKVRFAGIDMPDKGQPFSDRAKRFTEVVVGEQQVRVVVQSVDRYRRYIAEVFLPDGRSVNRILVKSGLAWHYKQYSKSADLASLEDYARTHKLGLWIEPSPVPPWVYRKQRRTARRRPFPSKRPDLVSGPLPGAPRSSGPVEVRGNSRSMVYHLPHCPSFRKVGSRNRVIFQTIQAAEAAGYRRARNCPP